MMIQAMQTPLYSITDDIDSTNDHAVFSSGKTAVLHCHYNDIPMHPLPFFQIFGNKVAM